MAFIQANIYSNVLNLDVGLNLILPQSSARLTRDKKDDVPVLYLLHGMGGNETAWMRRSSIERYVRESEIAVVMPTTELGFYTDTRYGMQYWTFISEELPDILHELFPQLTTKKEKTFAAGLSMGGYGAIKLGLRCPDKFAAVASLSGALALASDPEVLLQSGSQAYWEGVFGPVEKMKGSENDPIHLLTTVAPEVAPKLFVCCGTEDFLYQSNQYFVQKAQAAGFFITYEEGPGAHTWDFWDEWIQKVLQWLPVEI
ncbi:esterase family protein [Enterococcus sp. MJM12]|uniref:Esterase family protein n=1 Tax=Candidatus Enterococcus myersii TaxID=2815322 RepID=A0ABS3HAA6_9ENTE|nr:MULTISPECIES: alpha/beta hydrolase family protein [Enterococcus]MBO0449894.1 esterase family protein [Enterococcus sp. MJM12]MDT2740071.1 alpha/beta hydrolase family protein [Enterococcus canintestini]